MTGIERAVIVGGSVAGLAAALGLAPRVGEVTIVERHPAVGAASVVPQGPLPHVLLSAGARALDLLTPGFTDALFARGAVGDVVGPRPCHWWAYGAVRDHVPDLGIPTPLCSRDLVEGTLRERALALSNVTLRTGTGSGIALGPEGVRGVRLEDGQILPADLVVDATGRSGRGAHWLRELGVDLPERERVTVDVVYTAVDVPRAAGDLGGALFAVVQNSPALARIGVALPAEGDRWQVVLGGYFGEQPRRDEVRAYAAGLPDLAIAELLEQPWLTEPRRHRFPASERTRWDRAALPAGYCVVGDAVGSFNPIYGQGMTSAAQQAVALAESVSSGGSRAEVTREHARRTAAIVAAPWQVASGADFIYDRTAGSKPKGTDLVNRYLGKVMAVAATDETVNLALSRVQGLLARPESLLHPRVVARVLSARRGGVTTRRSAPVRA